MPVVYIDLDNQSSSRVIQSIEFRLSYHMRVAGWSWDGLELAQNRRIQVPLLDDQRPELNLQPGEAKGLLWPLHINPEALPSMPPTFRSKAMSLTYTLLVILQISGATEPAECQLALKFFLPEGSVPRQAPLHEELAQEVDKDETIEGWSEEPHAESDLPVDGYEETQETFPGLQRTNSFLEMDSQALTEMEDLVCGASEEKIEASFQLPQEYILTEEV